MKRGSITSKVLGLMLTLIMLSSSLSIFALANLAYSLGDARAINASGSLRMQSYRLMFYANSGSKEASTKILEFENTLYSPALQESLSWSTPQQLKDQYLLVIDKWKVMKHFIEEEDSRQYAQSLKGFVDTINLFVLETEHHAEFKLRLLAASQLFGLALMLAIAFVAVRYTKRKVVEPLNQLMLTANSISKGDFDIDMPKTEYIELQALADALDSTAKELSALYRDLEAQVQEKTHALTRTNQELNFLYHNLVMLHGNRLNFKALKSALDQLRAYQQLTHLRLVIDYQNDTAEVIEADGGWPADTAASYRFPLTLEHTHLGYLEIVSKSSLNRPLFENFAIMLARSIHIHQLDEQRQQLALMEERGVIARELHDSLGQVLTFLKIQISLLRKGLDNTGHSAQVEQQLNEISDGVNSAYGQLRELLSTFRLSITDPNLKHALETMLEQLRGQTASKITLNYAIREHLLGATQHIHILQVTREATLNAIKHANASEIVIECYKNADGMINISVNDNGIGVEHLKVRDQHFGIGIMHERANKLDGRLDITGNDAGGTTVTLTIPLHQEPNQHG